MKERKKTGKGFKGLRSKFLLSAENTGQGVFLCIPPLASKSTIHQHIKGQNTHREFWTETHSRGVHMLSYQVHNVTSLGVTAEVQKPGDQERARPKR